MSSQEPQDTNPLWYNGHQYQCTIGGSRTLVEDARAVLNGEADYLLGNDGSLADVDGIHGIDQGIVNAVASQAINMPTAPQDNVHPQVPVALVVLPVNNHNQHITAPAFRQCPHGCTDTFGRPGEYRRHMKKHNGPFFPCTHPYCGRMFYRQDKLRDHLNKGH
jgi:hypothetical protein